MWYTQPLATVSLWYQHLLSLFQCGFRMPCHYFSVVSTSFVAISVCIPIHCHCFSVVPVIFCYCFSVVPIFFCYCFSVHPIHSHCFSVLPIHCHCFSMLFRSFVTVSVWHLDLLSLSQCGISIFAIASVYFDPCHCFSVVSRSFVTVSVWYLDPCHYFSMISRSLPLFQYGISILCHCPQCGISILCHCFSMTSRSFVTVRV